MSSSNAKKIFNFNIGILGHVDSGKTTLAKALSTTASTAAFDKNPQSQERGITLDLGFSSFAVDMPSSFSSSKDPRFGDFEKLQFTLVDCPGHASLIRTVIGGSQIIDMVLLVVDAVKGVQTQTAECLVLGEVTCPQHMIVVLNKIDSFPEESRAAQVDKITKRLQKTLAATATYKEAPIVPVSASESLNLDKLIDMVVDRMYFPPRREDGKFLFAVDHCFSIRGQGTVMTGTVLSGSVKINDQIEIPSLKETKKVKSMQMFRQPVARAVQGDRIGLCVTQFDAKLFERGLVCQPGAVVTVYAAIVETVRIPYFKQVVTNKMKLHVSLGHETVMAKCQFFGCSPQNADDCACPLRLDVKTVEAADQGEFCFDQDYIFIDSFGHEEQKNGDIISQRTPASFRHLYTLLEFDQPVLCPLNALYIASKLDTDIHSNLCRLAFYGRIVVPFSDKNYRQRDLQRLRVFKNKTRRGTVERFHDEYTLIANGLFKKDTNVETFVGLKVVVGREEDEENAAVTQQKGVIEGGFGQSGKVKIRIPEGIKKETIEILQSRAAGKKRGGKTGAGQAQDSGNASDSQQKQKTIRVTLAFRRYVYDPQKKMVQ